VQAPSPARVTTSVFTTGASLGTAAALPAPPQINFPTRPVTIIVPFSAGGSTDLLARIVAQKFSDTLRQPVVVENRAGGGGTIGVAAAKTAGPDGHTLVVGTMATHALTPALLPSIPYDPRSDLAPVGLVAASPMTVVTRNSIPATDLRSFISYLKTNGAKATYASSGAGSESHVACAFFNNLIGAKSTHIPYRGVAPAIVDLKEGKVDYMCAVLPSIVSQLQPGSIKSLAVASAERLPVLANLPTTGEAGLPEFQASSWTAVFAPKGTPQPVIQKLNYALAMALEDAATKERLLQLFGEIPNRASRSPSALDAYLRAEVEKWTRVIKMAGITAN
jgi:tripartite-type tricarboxylate transporter receptor subunit TctC